MEKYYRAKEVAGITREDVMTVYRRIRSGELAAVHIGKRGIRVAESELQRWIASNQKK
jgi:excisionase family DNA binding protein